MITGTVADIRLGSVVIDVSGVGYLVSIQAGRGADIKLDTTLTLHTHLAVREDSLTLYGFFDRDTLDMFELLIELPKIGPKSALQILSQAEIGMIQSAVSEQDPAYLSKLSGIGKKTAEKIVQGLKDTYAHTAASHHGGRHVSDVIDALVTLGYSEKEARDTVQKLNPALHDTNARLKEALRILSR